jgi:protein-S-isoprenylcysteine O-methyltransferase Ste14
VNPATTAPTGLVVRAGRFVFKSRDLLFPVVMLALAFGTTPRSAGAPSAVNHAFAIVGLLVSLAGQALRVAVIGLEYITRGGQNREIWAKHLIEGGIFAHCRNPLYVGNVLIYGGLAIVHGGWAMYLVGMPFMVLAYMAVVRAEEEHLRSRFGDAYVRYCARVPRWIPSLAGLRTTLRGARMDWRRVVRKEYGTPFAWMSGMLVLLCIEHPTADPISAPELQVVVTAWIVLALLYCVARWMKLTGRLGQD